MSKIKSILLMMRPHQWVKSSFVFTGLIFGHRWHEAHTIVLTVAAAGAFSLASSGMYVINDLRDAAHDREHPVKRKRPIASGAVGPAPAGAISAILLLAAAGIAVWIGWQAALLLALYVAMNLGYSYGLKHVVILDVFVISLGFMLRILMGTIGIGIEPSHWLLFCGLAMTLFLGFCKRRAELLQAANAGGKTRRVLEHYSSQLLDLMIAVTSACAILSYSLYTIDDRTIVIHRTAQLIYTAPLVIYAIFRYLYLMYRQGGGEDTARDIFRDLHILGAIALWGALVLYLTWF
ncbi:MAG: decaprenyl-phosphate phosphoribosyltransferase [Leptospirales bacterium]|nr:decaprenyl-phosphate phosphoribosyltransferase [Leptospirales bacterium]